jgi:hypothetical protein
MSPLARVPEFINIANPLETSDFCETPNEILPTIGNAVPEIERTAHLHCNSREYIMATPRAKKTASGRSH